MKLNLTNQTMLLLRNLLSVPGVSKTAVEIYQDGELLCVTLPEPDLAWLKTEKEQLAMSSDDLKAYLAKDKAWGAEAVEVELTEKQRDRVKAVMSKVPELISVQQTKPLFALYKEFGFAPS